MTKDQIKNYIKKAIDSSRITNLYPTNFHPSDHVKIDGEHLVSHLNMLLYLLETDND